MIPADLIALRTIKFFEHHVAIGNSAGWGNPDGFGVRVSTGQGAGQCLMTPGMTRAIAYVARAFISSCRPSGEHHIICLFQVGDMTSIEFYVQITD